MEAGKSFESLARQYSIAPSRDSGGELPWMSFKTPATEGKTGGLPVAVAQALEKPPVGAVTVDSGGRLTCHRKARCETNDRCHRSTRHRRQSVGRPSRWRRRARSRHSAEGRDHSTIADMA
nr:peptidylprolyl isomerase [Burkholderia multivorans]